jgi:hypothetical protein
VLWLCLALVIYLPSTSSNVRSIRERARPSQLVVTELLRHANRRGRNFKLHNRVQELLYSHSQQDSKGKSHRDLTRWTLAICVRAIQSAGGPGSAHNSAQPRFTIRCFVALTQATEVLLLSSDGHKRIGCFFLAVPTAHIRRSFELTTCANLPGCSFCAFPTSELRYCILHVLKYSSNTHSGNLHLTRCSNSH